MGARLMDRRPEWIPGLMDPLPRRLRRANLSSHTASRLSLLSLHTLSCFSLFECWLMLLVSCCFSSSCFLLAYIVCRIMCLCLVVNHTLLSIDS